MKSFPRFSFAKLGPELSALMNKLQDALGEAIADIQKNPELDGTILENVEIQTTSTEIPHKLGRRLRGWYIVRKRANATIWDNQDSVTDPSKYLALQASAQVTVDIKVF